MKTTQITIRKVDLALEALREKVGDMSASKRQTGLQKYFGMFSEGAFDQSALDGFEAVDEAMWA
ncbi:MAG: hypothetical protein WCO52_00190 [bacterium]